jgi:hypothetical protein
MSLTVNDEGHPKVSDEVKLENILEKVGIILHFEKSSPSRLKATQIHSIP